MAGEVRGRAAILVVKVFDAFMRINIADGVALNVLARTRRVAEKRARFDGARLGCGARTALKIRLKPTMRLKIIRFIFPLVPFPEGLAVASLF